MSQSNAVPPHPVAADPEQKLNQNAACGAANRVRGRIASTENVTRQATAASSDLLPLPHAPGAEIPKILFPHRKAFLLLWTLWSCGRRASVVQA
jgi:hypothetical protein